MITSEDLLTARSSDGVGLCNCDLADSAAHAAAVVLAENWSDALKAGERIEDVVSDVEDVCAVLRAWREAVIHEYGAKSSERSA